MATDPQIKSELQRKYPDSLALAEQELAKVDDFILTIDSLREKYANQFNQFSSKFSPDQQDALLVRLCEKHEFRHAIETEINFAFIDYTEIIALVIFDMIMNEEISL